MASAASGSSSALCVLAAAAVACLGTLVAGVARGLGWYVRRGAGVVAGSCHVM